MIKARWLSGLVVLTFTGVVTSCDSSDPNPASRPNPNGDVEVSGRTSALVTKAPLPNDFVTFASFENTAVVTPPGTGCPNGAIALNLGQNNFKGVAWRPLFDASGAIDVATTTTMVNFNAAATINLGTDNQIVRMKDGSLLAERDIGIWTAANPAPSWANQWINGGGVFQGTRGGMGLFRSTDCGKTWVPHSTVDFATLAGGIYGAPRPSDANGVPDSGCANQGTYNTPGLPQNGKPQWWIGGQDRSELYADPFNGNVYLTTRVVSGPVCTGPGDTRGADHNEILLLVSTDDGLTWQVAQAGFQPYSPMVLTSTPDGRLFMFHQLGTQPTLYYSQPLATGQIPVMSAPLPVFYKDAANQPVAVGGPSTVDLFVQIGFPSISRISLDRTTSKVRVSYQARGAGGQQEMRVARVEVRPDTATPVIKNVAAVAAESPTDHSMMYFNFNDPEYVNMPAGTQANSSMAYWVEAPQCRTGELWGGQPDGTNCGNGCVNTQTNSNNCGVCQKKCATGQLCQAGVCAAACTAGTTTCGTACVNVQTDVRNCGVCGNSCAFSETCTAGACTAVAGKSDYSIKHMFFEGDCRSSPPLYLSVNTDHSPRTWKVNTAIGDYFSGGFWWDGGLNYLAHWSEPNGLYMASTPSPFGTSKPDSQIFIQGRTQADFSIYDTLGRNDGWLATDVGSYVRASGAVEINGVAHHTTLPSVWVQGFSYDDFKTKNDQLAAQGWSIDKLHSFVLANGAVRVDALWTLQPRAWALVQGYSLADFAVERDARVAAGYRLDYLNSFMLDGGVRIDAVWHKLPGGSLYVQGYTLNDFQTADNANYAQGWRVDQVQSVVLSDGSVRVDAVWHPSSDDVRWVQGYSYADFLDTEASLRCQSYELETLHSVVLPGDDVRVDAVWHRASSLKPKALCQDVTLPANTCNGTITPQLVNNGSSNPAGGNLTLSLSTTGPFTAGKTPVTLTVTNAQGQSDSCAATVRIGGTTPFANPYVVQLANGDVQYAITFAQKQAYVEAFVRQNGTQNISGSIVASEVNNGDGTFTYKRVAAAAQYHAGDAISARFYSYPAGSAAVYTPGPVANVWTPDFVYGVGARCTTATCNTYIRALPNGDLAFSVTTPAIQAYAEAFVRKGTTQITAGNIANDPVIKNGDGTYTYTRVVAGSNFASGDQVTVRFYSYVQGGAGVFVPGPTDTSWSATYVYGTTAPPACTAPVPKCTTAALPRLAATASSSENANTLGAAMAIDGNTATRWSSQFSNPQWIYVDLGQNRRVSRVDLNWEAAASADYDIQVAADGTGGNGPWTTVYSDHAGNGGIDAVTGLGSVARYVRMYSRTRTSQYGSSLWEFGVSGDLNASCAP